MQSLAHRITKAKQTRTTPPTHAKSTHPKLAIKLSNYPKRPISTEFDNLTFRCESHLCTYLVLWKKNRTEMRFA